MSEKIIELKSVNKWFGDFQVLKDVNLEVGLKQKIVVCGPSGSGKSTLIRCINRLEEHQQGQIFVDGIELTKATKDIEKIRAEVGMVFQQFNLFPHLSVLDNVSLAPIWVKKMPKKEAEELALQQLETVHILDQARKFPGQLSGGQQQRIALARSLAPNPTLMLLDEPFSNLDSVNRVDMLNDLQSIIRDSQMATILVTHDKEEAFSVADNLAVMVDGRINQYAKPNEIYFYPKNYKVAKLVSNAEFISGNVNNGVVDCYLGSFPYFDSTGEIDSISEVTVMIRFGDFRAVYDPNGNFFITSIEFKGSNYIVTVKSFKGATYIKSVESLDTNLAINSKVNLVPVNSDPLLVFPKIIEENV